MLRNLQIIPTSRSLTPRHIIFLTLELVSQKAKGNFSWYSVPRWMFNLFNSSTKTCTVKLYSVRKNRTAKRKKNEWKIRVKRVVARQSANRAKWRWENMPRIYGKSNLKWKLYALWVSVLSLFISAACIMHTKHSTLSFPRITRRKKKEKEENLRKPIDKKGRTARAWEVEEELRKLKTLRSMAHQPLFSCNSFVLIAHHSR